MSLCRTRIGLNIPIPIIDSLFLETEECLPQAAHVGQKIDFNTQCQMNLRALKINRVRFHYEKYHNNLNASEITVRNLMVANTHIIKYLIVQTSDSTDR